MGHWILKCQDGGEGGMNKTNKYYVVVSSNGFKWLFPKDGSSFMTIKELEDIDNGIVLKQWKVK